ncbi:MAG TPA: hypothetical protein PLW11_09190 [Bacillota bacterium]|nr:hypothetical protein [Salinivirgaceae bacterium]HPL54288.1 hypothetical protein [Bacillota bacterium]
MSVIDKLACSLGRNDEIPNQELAKELCRTKDSESIKELVQCLFNGTTAIKNDSIKVLYEIGEAQPELISSYVDDFITLLNSKNNRLVWGSMTALSTIANINPGKIFENINLIFDVMEKGSVITVDNGVSVLAKVGSTNKEYEKKALPFLLKHLETCRPREVAQHSERSMAIANSGNKVEFQRVLEKRLDDLSQSQQARVKRVLKKVNSM